MDLPYGYVFDVTSFVWFIVVAIFLAVFIVTLAKYLNPREDDQQAQGWVQRTPSSMMVAGLVGLAVLMYVGMIALPIFHTYMTAKPGKYKPPGNNKYPNYKGPLILKGGEWFPSNVADRLPEHKNIRYVARYEN